jgi:hypothetical protein
LVESHVADPLYEPVFELSTICLARATGQGGDADRYRALRDELVAEPRVSQRLPTFVRACRDLGAFWAYIQPKFGGYAARRAFIREEFQGLLDDLEHDMPAADREVTEVLRRLTTDSVREVWERAQTRRAEDPDGAITLARTLLETVCKHILAGRGVAYDEGDELPRLYRLTAESLQIAPNAATEDSFRRIFGGCTSIVESLGTIRNRIGDAHGRGVDAVRVEPRYARLAVNMSGAMATFLVETWDIERAR